MEWKPIETAPRDGTPILLFDKVHGCIQGWFCAGEWSEDTPVSPAEYSGPVWVLGDDIEQIEIEEYGIDALRFQYHDGSVTHWMPLPPPPPNTGGE